jgi:polar amino acid transport system substrate-binding protein
MSSYQARTVKLSLRVAPATQDESLSSFPNPESHRRAPALAIDGMRRGRHCPPLRDGLVKFASIALPLLALIMPGVGSAADCAMRAPGGLVKAGKLTIATVLPTPPHAFFDEDRMVGFAVEIGQAMARQMCLDAEFVPIASDGLFSGLNAHKVDTVIAGVVITSERQQSFDVVPYFQDGVRLVVQKNTKLWFASERDLCGRKVATQTGSSAAISLERANRETCPAGKKIAVMGHPNFNEAVRQLRKNAAEAAFVDWPFANYLAQMVPDLALGSADAPGRPRNKQGIVVRKGDSETATALADALARIQAGGEYETILAKWNLSDGDIRRDQ